MRAILVLLLLVVVSGCGAPKRAVSKSEYPAQLAEILSLFAKESLAQAQTLSTKFTAAPRAQKLETFATGAEKMARIYANNGRRVDKLRPTKPLSKANSLAKKFFSQGGQFWLDWAKEVRRGSPKSQTMGDDGAQLDLKNLGALITEVERVEGPQPALREQLEKIREPINQ
jgi:hypothetical protein